MEKKTIRNKLHHFATPRTCVLCSCTWAAIIRSHGRASGGGGGDETHEGPSKEDQVIADLHCGRMKMHMDR